MDKLSVFNKDIDCINEISSREYYKSKAENKTYTLSHIQSVDNKFARDFAKKFNFKLSGYSVYSKDFRPSVLKKIMNSERYWLEYKVDEYSKYIKLIAYISERKSFTMKSIEYCKKPRIEKDLSFEDILERIDYHGKLYKVDEKDFFSKAYIGMDKWALFEESLSTVKVTLIGKKVMVQRNLDPYREVINVYGSIENTNISLYSGIDTNIEIQNPSVELRKLAIELSELLNARINIIKKKVK